MLRLEHRSADLHNDRLIDAVTKLRLGQKLKPLVHKFDVSLPEGWEEQLPTSELSSEISRMQFVLQLASWNVANKTGGPFAAAIFESDTGELVSIGVNRVVPSHCSIAHAEAVAIALAQQKLQSHDLADAGGKYELFASGQPCVQCFGMTWWSGVTRLVIGARSSDIERLTSFREGPLPDNWQSLLADRDPLPPIEVVQDVCRTEACEVLANYTKAGGDNYSPGQT